MPSPGLPVQVPGDSPPRSSGTAFSRAGASQPGEADVSAICSAKGCTAPAVWELRWNNPKLHTPDRRKVWLACGEHKSSLGDFLAARS